MKIGRPLVLSHSRRVPVPEKPPKVAPAPAPPKRRALLIGISYQGSLSSGQTPLKGPHADVRRMHKLLIEKYGYAVGDIVVLLDDEGVGLQPTRVNILRAIGDLVRGAKKGDRFFFHYCGHTTQMENRSNSEEDGMDECLVPSDGDDNKIMDNELRRHLVDALPVGSSLVAVFDSCHSASLLDLAHFRCNRVYVPWISKGRRRSDERWNANVRRLALPLLPLSPQSTSPVVTRSNTMLTTSTSPVTTGAPTASSPFALTASQQAKSTKRATKRATREMRQLAQLLSGPFPLPESSVPATSSPLSSIPPPSATSPTDGLVPTRPGSPTIQEEEEEEEEQVDRPPMVATRRIYEATRTSKMGVRAYRTEIDELDLGSSGVGSGILGGEAKQQQEGLKRAATEEVLAATSPVEEKGPKRRKRSSLALFGSLSRSGSFSLNTGFTSRAGSVSKEKENREASVDVGLEGTGAEGTQRRTAVVRARAVSVAVGKENVPPVPPPTRESGLRVDTTTTHRPTSWLEDGPSAVDRACESPEPVWLCQGTHCRDAEHGHLEEDLEEKAEVISLASCKDSQLSWEDADGGSMTRELVRILEKDPHPTYRALLASVSHAMHNMSLKRHIDTRRYKRECKRYAAYLERLQKKHGGHQPPARSLAKDGASEDDDSALTVADSGVDVDVVLDPRPPMNKYKAKSGGFLDSLDPAVCDMDNFQDPQLASHKPLDMERPFTI
ncbi:caspase domain-containing protein [Roridomyces roridus]|uniref:Caspase domain-containing protein n=1 Tax=Roridomyces roridus TaxID=1738132 RepID=A0AAD7FGB8_9AGAR|nr:caspase domain-containing protein [Roridomyces roridus]